MTRWCDGGDSEETAIVVEVQLLGPVGIADHEEAQPIRSDKQRMLLAHLALAGGTPVHERLLVDELWDEPPADPRHALQAHVSRLRQATGLPIEHSAGGYRLSHRGVATDAARFEELLRQAQAAAGDGEQVRELLSEAIAQWRGSALENLPATPGVHGERTRLHLLYDKAVTELIDAHLEAGQPAEALPLLYSAVETNPVDERRWGQLMVALDDTGQRSAALEVFARARGELVNYLGLDPGEQLQQIHYEILTGSRAARARAPDAGPPVAPPAAVVGRDDEWAVLTRLWAEARIRQRVAVLSGEPGIGKTYLARRFAATLPTVHRSRAHATSAGPYEILADLIRSDCQNLDASAVADRLGPDAEALRSLVPELVARIAPEPAPSSLAPDAEHHRIERAVRDWLRRATSEAPLCLIIDDLQWADTDSLRLVRDVWAGARELPVLWLVTMRKRDDPPGSPGGALLAEALRPADHLTRLRLAGLDRPAVADLVRSTLGSGEDGEVTERTLDDLLAATAGNPLLVLETARHLADHGGPAHLSLEPVPPSLATIVAEHITWLDPVGRELLEVAAILGEEFDPLIVGTAARRDSHEVDLFLATAQKFGLLAPVNDGDPTHRFRHALVHAVVEHQIPPVRRAQLHLRVARAVEGHPYVPDRLHVLAHHYARAVRLIGAEEAIGHLLAAADASLGQHSPAAARALYQQAYELLTEESPLHQRCDVHLGLGKAGFRAGTDYREDLLTAARLAHEMGDADRLVRAAVANNRGWYSSTAEIDRDRVAVIDTALTMLPAGDPKHQAARARLLALWAMEIVRDPTRRDDALGASAESMDIAEALGDETLLGEVMSHRFSVLYATARDPAATARFAKELDDFAHVRIDRHLQLASATAVAQATFLTGDVVTADRALDRAERLAAELAHPARMWLIGTWRATRTAGRGDIHTAREQATAAYERATAFGQPDAAMWYAGQLFVFHHMTGRLPDLLAAIEEQATALGEQMPAWRAAYALVLATAGRHGQARAIVDEFRLAGFAQLPVDVLYLHALSYLAETVTRTAHAPAAGDLYAALLPFAGMLANNATIDAGPVDLRLGELAHLSGDHGAARRHLERAAELCRGGRMTSWLPHVDTAMARLRPDRPTRGTAVSSRASG